MSVTTIDGAKCAVQGCPIDAVETIHVTAAMSCNQPNPYLLQEVEMDVPLCPGHHDLLTHDAAQALSIG